MSPAKTRYPNALYVKSLSHRAFLITKSPIVLLATIKEFAVLFAMTYAEANIGNTPKLVTFARHASKTPPHVPYVGSPHFIPSILVRTIKILRSADLATKMLIPVTAAISFLPDDIIKILLLNTESFAHHVPIKPNDVIFALLPFDTTSQPTPMAEFLVLNAKKQR